MEVKGEINVSHLDLFCKLLIQKIKLFSGGSVGAIEYYACKLDIFHSTGEAHGDVISDGMVG